MKQLKIRVPEDVKTYLQTQAKLNVSSQSSEVVRCIRMVMVEKNTAPEGKFADRPSDAVEA